MIARVRSSLEDMLSALCFSRGARAWQSVFVNLLLTEAALGRTHDLYASRTTYDLQRSR